MRGRRERSNVLHLAPRSMSKAATCAWPHRAASMSASFLFPSAPASRHACTFVRSPAFAALMRSPLMLVKLWLPN